MERLPKLVVTAAMWMALASTAHADGAVPPFFLNTWAPIPSDGAIVIDGRLVEPPQVTLTPADASATAVAAHVRQRGLHWAFIPDAPLVPGEYQLAEGPGAFGTGFHDMPLTVIEPIGDVWPELMLDPEPTPWVELRGYQDACCFDWNGTHLVETAQCYTSQVAESVAIDITFTALSSASIANQFFIEVIAAGNTAAEGDLDKLPSASSTLWFSQQQAEYCFEVRAMRITTGEVRMLDELAGCVAHGELPDLGGPMPEDPSFRHDLCKIPPVGFEALWCQQHENTCLAAPNAIGCEYAGYVCRGEPLPVLTAEPMPMAEPDAGATMMATSDAAVTPEPERAKSGCAITVPRTTGPAPLSIFVLGVVARLRRSRRRAR